MLENLITEKRNQDTDNLDELSIREIVYKMNEEDAKIATAIQMNVDSIEQVIRKVIICLQQGGRLFYIGAGTSGRLGVLDAAECVPTFSIDPEMIQGVIAGGKEAMIEAIEGAEDLPELGKRDLGQRSLCNKDFVLGISASGRTPYVIGALKYANEIGASTGSLSCNYQTDISKYAEFPIEISAGPEVLTGSTRLKAGTIQKMVLNMISTVSMVGLGKVFKNLMVDVKPTNKKLNERAITIIMEATECNRKTAEDAYLHSDKKVKLAIVQLLTGKNKEDCQRLLSNNDGFIRKAIYATNM